MISRPTLAHQGQRALQFQPKPCTSRCFASAASGSFNYETGDAAGVKVASRDLPGPTTHLAVGAKAGTRYQPLPGFSEGLEKIRIQEYLETLGSKAHKRDGIAWRGIQLLPLEREFDHWRKVSSR
ncbi:hypothetical protein ABVK25_001492 [Lepraria finkii]|uniref:Uncharacterized protein n=1 Tax=Lepraria finkii TaxID=1340010 RepID=A0ABR4BJ85_9LECA